MNKSLKWITAFFAFSIMTSYADLSQSANAIIMVSPDTFQYDKSSSEANSSRKFPVSGLRYQKMAAEEFKQMVAILRANKIKVIVLPSRSTIVTPNAVFPTWFSIHQTEEGKRILVLYPMLEKNRRDERQVASLKAALHGQNIMIDNSIDLSSQEKKTLALEGMGSVVLDRKNKVLFASLSNHTDPMLLAQLAKKLNYESIIFHSIDSIGDPIDYTNTVLNIGSQFAIVADKNISDPMERAKVFSALNALQKDIIPISLAQKENWNANILEVRNIEGQSKIIMSKTAYNSFTPEQLTKLSNYGDIIVVNIDTIEKLGGQSARSMLAEVF